MSRTYDDWKSTEPEIIEDDDQIEEDEEGHYPGCVCADCSGAELTADND